MSISTVLHPSISSFCHPSLSGHLIIFASLSSSIFYHYILHSSIIPFLYSCAPDPSINHPSFSLFLHDCIPLSLLHSFYHPSISPSSVCLSLRSSIHLINLVSLQLSVTALLYPSINLSLHPSILPSFHLSIPAFLYPSICPYFHITAFLHLSVYPSSHLSIRTFLSITSSLHPCTALSLYLSFL